MTVALLICVLTEPDRIENSTGEKWGAVLRNEENRLVIGWFCIKQPDPTELKNKITWEEARTREDMFFAGQEPWKSLKHHYRPRLGSYNLIRYLSRLLSSLVALRLPNVEMELSNSLEDVNNRLKKLPAPNFEDPSSELVRLIFEFTVDLSRNAQDGSMIRFLDYFQPYERLKKAFVQQSSALRRGSVPGSAETLLQHHQIQY